MSVRRVKVLHFYKTSLPQSMGGVEVFIDTLCNASASLNVENVVLSLADAPRKDPIQMHSYLVLQAQQNLFVASTGFSLAAFHKLHTLAKDADIIHYHFPNPFADMLHFVCKINKPVVVTYHADIIKQQHIMWLYAPLMHKFLRAAQAIVATSANYVQTSETLQQHRDKVKVIPIGINKANLAAVDPERVRYWRERLPEKFFLFVGALRYYKGLHVALAAVRRTDYQLVLAGAGGVEAELKEQARGLANVHFVGAVSDQDKAILHHLSYAFVFPSHLRSEAFGISLLEAAAFGKAAISCEIGTGTSLVNVDQATGLVVEPGSAPALRAAMQFLLDNPDKTAAFGVHAEKRYAQMFTAEQQALAYRELYEGLLS